MNDKDGQLYQTVTIFLFAIFFVPLALVDHFP